ncbi:MAG: RluA family pseudouridine synthase, partial [bacterium]|nr:RluA family pseudouridine synthase [bacterium]
AKPAEEKIRLDLLLLEKFPAYNRSTLQTFVESGFVKANGEIVKKPNAKFPPDVELELSVPAKTPLKTPPEILFEDENVLVLDKPAGLLSMSKGEYCPEWTLEDFGLLVHRLDRDTSGVVVLAKNPETQSFLRRQFQDRKTKKTYLAVVEGHPKLPAAEINLPLARNLNRPTTFRVDPSGKESVTFYKTLATSDNPPLALLELQPQTGRTHQLRVHLSYIGTPILGDPVYNPKSQASRL